MTEVGSASGATGVGAMQQQVLKQIDGRLRQLATPGKSVHSSHLSASEQAQLDEQLRHDVTGLQHLRAHAASDTTVDELRADQHSMVVDYRVWKVMTPKVQLAESF